ncbi:MAG: RdgB/HAM1 family non-canonical purine NTP pyrophosphatase [Acutalibacteraceae bacterium]
MLYMLASNNPKKLEELSRVLKPLGVSVTTPSQMGFEVGEIEETGITFEENAEIKAKTVCELTGYPTIADDSGLMVDALDGRPGVYSARYGGEDTPYEKKINTLLGEMMRSGNPSRAAHFVCVICCYYPDGKKIIVRGETDGTIGYAPRGKGGFGYDPIFFTEGNKTFAELSETQKDAISHRGRALRQLVEKLREQS